MNQAKIPYKADILSKILRRMLAVNGCLVLIFSFLLIFGHSHASSTRSVDQFVVQTKLKIHKESDQPGKNPLRSHQIPEDADQLESIDNFDDGSDKSICHSLSSNGFVECSGKSLLQHLKHSIEIRPQISLFILHHSWKSFLV